MRDEPRPPIHNRTINSLRNELDAARKKLRATPPDKQSELIGYIRGLQVAMLVARDNRLDFQR